MRSIRKSTVVCATAAFALVLAACGEDTTPEDEPNNPPTSAGSDTLASCVVGEWRSQALSADTGGDPVSADLTGGEGITVRIENNGSTTIDFSSMSPIEFTANVAGADVTGQFSYGGDAVGTINTSAAGASPTAGGSPTATGSPATTGTWRPVGDLNWQDTTLTVKLTDPIQVTPLDNAPIGQYTGDAADRTGDVVDIDPFFDEGTYRCMGDTLTITPDDDSDLPWTLTRA
jgi:hypothetical protein